MKFQELKNRFNKKYAVRIIAGVLSIALIGTGSAFYGVSTAKAANETTTASKDTTEESLLSGLLSGVTVSEKVIGKEESVYLITDAAGTVQKTIVSDRLTNPDKKDTITDKSTLSDIVNVKGNETFTQSDTTMTWQAQGKEICYQGTTTALAPVSQKVTYYLDGKEIKPEDLAGKSGKVTIRFDYTNNTSYTATVNGKKIDVKVPFAAVSAVLLNDHFENVEVTNGKAKVSDGKSVVIGYTLPGLSESLDVEDGSIPEYFEITADVKEFELTTAMTLVVNAANYMEADGLDLTKLDETIQELSDAAARLQDGSSQLSDGLDTLKTNLVDFVDGMTALNNGKDALAAGVEQLNSSAKTLSSATTALETALKASLSDKEKENYKQLAIQGVDAKFEAGTRKETADLIYKGLRYNADGTDSQLYTTLYNGAVMTNGDMVYNTAVHTVLASAVAQASGGTVSFDTANSMTDEQLKAVIQNQYATLYGGLTQVGAAVAGNPTATVVIENSKNIVAVLKSMSAAELAEFLYAQADVASGEPTGTTLYAKVKGYADSKSDMTIKAGVEASIKVIAESMAGACQTAAQTAASEALLQGIDATKSNILAQITAKQANGYSFVTGMQALSKGTDLLASQVPTLTGGITKLTDASLLIQDGVNKLDDGANQLADGILQFNEEGIEKIVNAYNGDVKDLADKLQAVLDAGEEYQVFTDIADDTNGSVKFIYKLGSVTL